MPFLQGASAFKPAHINAAVPLEHVLCPAEGKGLGGLHSVKEHLSPCLRGHRDKLKWVSTTQIEMGLLGVNLLV